MSGPIGSSQWMYSSSTGFYDYIIDQSLRFNDGDNPYLNRTPSSAGNQRTWTLSAWVKRSAIGNRYNTLFSAKDSSLGNYLWIQFTSTNDDQLTIYNYPASDNFQLKTNQLFRDVSSWYHIVVTVDTTNGTSGDRIKLYVNGDRVTSFSTENYPSQNYDTAVNKTNNHNIGSYNSGSYDFDGYLAEINLLDGLAYDASYFGETKDGVWVPKSYSGSYGTNGFYLSFADSSAIGDDLSGNGNDFTANNLAASDVVPDSPTNNFATLNFIGKFNGESSNTKTFSEGNLKVAQSGGGSHDTATIAIETGHTEGYYWEVIVSSMDTARTYIGIVADDPDSNSSLIASYGFSKKYIMNRNGTLYGNDDHSATTTATYTAYAQGDIVMVAYKNGKIWFGVNGTWMNSGDPANGTGFLTAQDGTSPSDRNQAAWLPYFGYRSTFIVNFGQNGTFNETKTAQGNSDENGIGNFYYSVPSGFLTLCTANLPDPTIGPGQTEQADDNFNTVLYTGDGSSSNAITGVGFQPDWIWLKSRSAATIHNLFDSLRGTKLLQAQAGDAQQDNANYLTAYGADGFTVGSSSNVNASSATFVAWNWKAGGTPSGDNSAANNAEPTAGSAKIDGSNKSGAFSGSPSIAIKRLSANTTAGFSIVQWTGTGSAGTIPHGLGAAPHFYVVKNLTDDSTNWQAYHRAIASDAETDYIYFTSAQADDSDDWNDTAPTANVFSVKSHNQVNASGDSYLAYLFTSIEGYSRFGEYQANNSTDGPFIYLGFRPRLIWFKRHNSTGGSWRIMDTARDTINVADARLFIDTADDEDETRDVIDFLSNGFKLRANNNGNNGTATNRFIYAAWAEAPFKFSNAR